jgi:hypothetical protein
MATDVLRIARRQKNQMAQADARALEQLARVFGVAYSRLEGDVEALQLAIAALDSPTIAQVKALPQYRRLIRNATRELDDFGAYLNQTIGAVGSVGIELGLGHSSELMTAITGQRFIGLQRRVMGELLHYLRPDGPLYARLALITDGTIDRVVREIAEGVGLGRNPRAIARGIQDAFGGGLTDALRNTRTVQLWSYRDSARGNYMSAGGIVEGWIWYAELDGDVCMSCAAQHGTIHEMDEQLDDHYNGRCAALPYIPEFGNPVEQSGEEWFGSLAPEQQASMMGRDKLAAYNDGKFQFGQLSEQRHNDVYGTMRGEASLKSLLGESE